MNRLLRTILIATANQGKVWEIRDLVRDLPVSFLSLADIPDVPDVVEDADSFEGNALKKARTIASATSMVTLADDSGLCVDALGGAPGVFSARYGGPGLSDEAKCLRILQEMRDIPDDLRTARFVCVVALVSPHGESVIVRGACEGRITRTLVGAQGFGYDPIFFYEPAGLTFAEMDMQAKNAVSHRGEALRQFAEYLRGVSAVQTVQRPGRIHPRDSESPEK
ncbi:MAG: XTP/dITP diphosphatase [Thermodesulfobacteriota bacterium]